MYILNVYDVGLISHIMHITQNFLHCERVSVMLLSKDKQRLIVTSSSDLVGFEIPAGGGISGAVILSGQLLNVEDAYQDPR